MQPATNIDTAREPSTDILLIEDTPSLQLLYASVLRNAGYSVRCASTAQEGYSAFTEVLAPVVILDLMLPDRDGLSLLEELISVAPDTNVIVVTANGSVNRAVSAMRAGAHEFLVKPFEEGRMLGAVRNAVETGRQRSDVAFGPTGATQSRTLGLAGFVGSSSAMQQVYARVHSVAPSMATVFITGESGTGKEVCAQAVHSSSGRARGPFVPLNCGAIPSELLESEVFGHLRGSFTGAISDKMGAAEAADGGTLFLDEVCEMPLSLQTKLLRFLQTSSIQPVGATRPKKINARIICATNRDPVTEVRQGRFREDLFYRLHVIPIHLPPLRERDDDVLEIAHALLDRQGKEEGKRFSGITNDVAAHLRALPWPGNVRQLQNAIRHIVVLHDGPQVTLDMLPDALLTEGAMRDEGPTSNGAGQSERHGDNLGSAPYRQAPFSPPSAADATALSRSPGRIELGGKTLAEIERLAIEAAIARNDGSVPKAARELGVSPSTIYRKRETWTDRRSDA